MEISPSPERQKVPQAPGEVIARVGIHHLEEAEDQKRPKRDQMQIPSKENRPSDRSHPKNQGLRWVSVFPHEAKRGLEFVVLLMDMLVERAPVESAVSPVLPGVLDDEEAEALEGDFPEGGKGEGVAHADELGGLVEAHHHGELDNKVVEHQAFKAAPVELGGHFFVRLWETLRRFKEEFGINK